MKNSNENPTTDNQGVKTDSVQTDENVSVETTGSDNKTLESLPYARFNEVTKKKESKPVKSKKISKK